MPKFTPSSVLKICLSVLLLWIFALPSSSLAQAGSQASLIEGAKKEGQVVWYTTMSNPDNQAMVKSFNAKYPFLKVQVLRTSGEKLRQRILTETRAGQFFFDVVAVSELELGVLASRRLLLPYRSPEAAAYPAGARDKDGHFTGIYARNFVIGYNTAMIAEKDAPRDWPDLLRPEWKGKIGLDEEEFEWYGTLIDYWGREKTVKYMKQLEAQKPQLRRGHTLLTQLLAAGEFPIAIVFPYTVEQFKAKGAPIDWARGSDPIVTSINGIALSAKAPNPNGARLLVDYILSEDGQNVIRDRFRVPVRPGVVPLSPKLMQSELKLHYVPANMHEHLSQFEKEFRELFWKQR